MSTAVYSTQLAAQKAFNGTLDVLVPTGFILVVRDIDVSFFGNGTTGSFNFFGNISNELWGVAFAASGFQTAQWRGRQVFETGQMFQLTTTGGSGHWPDFQISGYKLTLP